MAAVDTLGNHHPQENPVSLVAVEADGVEVVVHKRGRPGATFEGGEDHREPGDAVEIGDETTGDGEAVELVRLDDFPQGAAGRADDRLLKK